MDLIRVAETLIEKIKKDYKDDIALVVIMGSYIYNDIHDKSDLDMYYVPKTQRGYNLGFTFVMDGRGFDYWPVSWERLERIAEYEEKTTSIVTEGRLLYYSSENDLARFNEIKRKALDISDKHRFIQKASNKLDEAYKDYFKLINTQCFSDVRMYTVGIIYTLTWALSLLNRISVKRGRGKLKQEIMDMPLVPKDFSMLYDTVFFSCDIDLIRDAYGKLLKNTEELILSEKEKIRETVQFSKALDGFFEEMINFYNKIYHACDIGDAYTALYASVDLTYEIEQIFTGTGVSSKQLPNIVGAYDPEDLSRLVSCACEHQLQFVKLLLANGVAIRQFNDFNELESYLETL